MSAPRKRQPDAAERRRLVQHRGLASWGDRLVPLEQFRAAVAASGHDLPPADQRSAVAGFLAPRNDDTPLEGPWHKAIVFGGIYNNHIALARLLVEAQEWGAEAVYCLGDLGGFGPRPELVWPLLQGGSVRTIQGNYEDSLSSGREDCNCGYSDPRDNHFAEISYRYTAERCSEGFKRWMGDLPPRRRVAMAGQELLLVHGSPRQINEFLFDSACPDAYLEVMLTEQGCQGLLCTHTGLHWSRRLPSGRWVANVGVIGRPANDGRTCVWYARVWQAGNELKLEHVPLFYDHRSLAGQMRSEGIPEEFVATIESGWWTTCLEVLPVKERARSKF